MARITIDKKIVKYSVAKDEESAKPAPEPKADAESNVIRRARSFSHSLGREQFERLDSFQKNPQEVDDICSLVRKVQRGHP